MKLQTIISGIVKRGLGSAASSINHIGFGITEPEGGACVIGSVKERRGVTPLFDYSHSPLLAVGPCRSGKSAGFVVPTLLSWRGSAVVHDVRSELHDQTAPWRATHAANRVIHFDGCSDSTRDKYNPVDAIRIGTKHALEDAKHLARCLIADAPGAGEMWVGWARNELYRRLLAEACRGGSLAKVVEAIRKIDLDCPIFDATGVRDEHPEIYAAIIETGLNPYFNNPKAHSAVLGMICEALSTFVIPELAANTSSSTFTLDDVADAQCPATLYLVTTPHDLARTEVIRRVVLAQIVRRLTEGVDHKHKVLLMLDDLIAFGELAFLPDAVSYMRKYGVKCCLTVPSLHQLHSIYGPEKANVLCRNSNILAFKPTTVDNAMPLYEATDGEMTKERLMGLEQREALLFTSLDGEMSQVAVPMYFDTEPFRSRAKRG